MATDYEKLVLGKLSTSKGESCSAISRKMGFQDKAKKVQVALDSLVEEGYVLKDLSGQYPTYKKVVKSISAAPSKSVSPEPMAVSSTKELSFAEDTGDNHESIPGVQYVLPKHNHGYKIDVKIENDALVGFVITDPNNKIFKLTPEQRVLVINNNVNSRYKINSPEEILAAISEYSKEKGIGTFTIKNCETNSEFSSAKSHLKSVYKTVIIFVEISAVNKAGK